MSRWLCGLVLLFLVACGGSGNNQPSQPVDETLQRETNAGQIAFKLERPEEAVARYEDALKRAQARDDLGAIGDLGFNLAVAELEANHPTQALEVARSTEQELQRRGKAPFAGLTLVQATALYRTGDLGSADQMAGRIAGTNDKEAAARANFLRGLIADDRGDVEGLATAAQYLKSASSPSLQADSAEVQARLWLRRKDFGDARRQAEQAARLRQQTLDYRGLARALALGGEAAKQAGDSKAAADLFLRAGRSAAAQGDNISARDWLKQSASLATDESLRSAANDLLGKLGS